MLLYDQRSKKQSDNFQAKKQARLWRKMVSSSKTPQRDAAQENARIEANMEAERRRVDAIEPGRKLSDPAIMRIHIGKLEEAPISKWTGRPYTPGYAAIVKKRRELPLREAGWFTQILAMLTAGHRVMIVTAPMGSGKSTQIPQMVAWYQDLRNNESSARIVCTQPSNLTARTCGERLRQEMDVAEHRWPEVVGYKYRGIDFTNSSMAIEVTTDEQLLETVLKRPQLLSDDYEFVIVDEAHERTATMDVLLLFLKEEVMRKGSTLRIIVMSATLNVDLFESYFADCPGQPAVVRVKASPRFDVAMY